MKKNIITSLILLGIFSQNCFGQLKVDSLGNVGVHANTTKSLLTVGGYGYDDYTMYLSSVQGRKGVTILNKATVSFPRGITVANYYNGVSESQGIRIIPIDDTATTTGKTYGIYSIGGGSTTKPQ